MKNIFIVIFIAIVSNAGFIYANGNDSTKIDTIDYERDVSRCGYNDSSHTYFFIANNQ